MRAERKTALNPDREIMKPPKHTEPSIVTLFRVFDSLLGAVVFALLCTGNGMPFSSFVDASFMILFLVVVVFTYLKVYRTWQVESILATLKVIVKGCLVTFLILVALSSFLSTLQNIPAQVFAMWLVSWFFLLILTRIGFHWLMIHRIIRGTYNHNAIIYGINATTPQLIRWIQNNSWMGINVKCIFNEQSSVKALYGIKVIRSYELMPKYVRDNKIDIVYLSLTDVNAAKADKILKDLSDTTAAVYLISDILSYDFVQNARVIYHGNLLVFSLFDTPHQGVSLFIKRLEDIAVSAVGLVLVSPLLLLAAVGIKLTSPGPVLFRQWRYGLNGHPIQVLKFRTMTVAEDGYAFQQVIRNDSRVTHFGKFLRKTSIDELPQLFNVLRGDMSLIGPRPHAISMVDEYRKQVPGAMLRHMIKPGITGLAQIYGTRGEIDSIKLVEERIRYDQQYLKNWSLYLDIKILLKTAVILFTKEAY